MKQNEKLLNNMKEFDKQKLPKWFNGELYSEGAEVRQGLGWFRKNNAEAYMILLD